MSLYTGNALEMCVRIRDIRCWADFCIGPNVTTYMDPTSYSQNVKTCQASGSTPEPSTKFYRLFPYFSFCLKFNLFLADAFD